MEQMMIPMARPLVGREESEAVARVLASGWVMQGPEVDRFEMEFATRVGAAHACAVSSGTAALHLALLAVGVRSGDEVITVSHSFIATANTIRHCGAAPVFVDIDPATFNIDASSIERAITARTRAISCVHQMGMPCDLEAVVAIARRHRLAVVEDAACAAGSRIRLHDGWEPIGRPHGDVACFSFHPRKLITTGDGGMITTNDPDIDLRVRTWRSHGFRDGIVGFNYRMTDLQAAIGRVQLGRLDGLVDERRRLVSTLRDHLSGIVEFPTEPDWARTNWQSLCVRLRAGVSVPAVISALDARGIASRAAIGNAHEQPAYVLSSRLPLPESERARRTCLLLPLPSRMTAAEIEYVAAAVREAVR